MKLYHFTRRVHLSSIFSNGITRGHIPLRFTGRGLDAVCLPCISLTEHGRMQDQKSWALPDPDKNIRLTVDLEEQPKLVKWKYVPDLVKMDRKLWKALRGDPYKWWVLFGTIPATQITEVFDSISGRLLSAPEIESLKHEPHVQGVPIPGTILIDWNEAVRN